LEVHPIEKHELDYRIIVEKTRHNLQSVPLPLLRERGTRTHTARAQEENQYGPQVRAMSLTLMNQGNVTLNKAAAMIRGFTGGEISPSEGYLCKLQRRAADGAQVFCDELRVEILKQSVVY
jgi:hypothetical protein